MHSLAFLMMLAGFEMFGLRWSSKTTVCVSVDFSKVPQVRTKLREWQVILSEEDPGSDKTERVLIYFVRRFTKFDKAVPEVQV